MSDLIVDKNREDDSYNVTLPCNPDDFADFVSSILGKGENIEKVYSDPFDISIDAIQQLFYLISQRVDQNGGKLVRSALSR